MRARVRSECDNSTQLRHYGYDHFDRDIAQTINKDAGLPKAIPLAHRYLLGYAGCHQFPPSQDESKLGLNLSTLPLFHVSHLY